MTEQSGTRLGFADEARASFAFLNELGFSETGSSAVLVHYEKAGVEVNVSDGPEIEVDVSYLRRRYALADIVRVSDPEAARQHGTVVASTEEGVALGLREMAGLLRRCGAAALQGDANFFATLEAERKVWADDYWLDSLARQLRPQAEAAFLRGDYAEAASLFARIRPHLSSAEIRKLEICKDRSGR
jgi:hypothetical protein